MDFKLKDAGLTFQGLKKVNFIATPKQYERHRNGTFEFKTPSKKIELYSSLLDNLGYDPLPHYLAPPETTDEYPLILMGGKKKVEYLHTAGRQIKMLRERAPEPIIEMSPDTAKEKGIAEGDWVWLETIYFGEKERVRFMAKLIEGFHPKIVAVDHGWWFPEEPDPDHGCFVSNANVIIPADVYDPVFGCTNLRSIPCRIYRA
jgi:anaerobic selenocysteine-containing dehydrogenase